MARFKIISKDGNTIRYEGKPRYNGSYLRPSYLEFSEIASAFPIEWEVGDYVDYPRTGMRYRLYLLPQLTKNARKGSNGKAFSYSGVQFHAATKELEIALFKDLVTADNNIHFSTIPDVATFEDVYGIARRIQANMDYFYPDRWVIRIAEFDENEDAEILGKIRTAKDFALSNGTCLDALSKIYELWEDIGWMHSYENGKEVITIGYSNKRIETNTTDAFIYGKGNGLTAIKKNQANKSEFATRLYVYGSERNIPSRYYNGLDILNAESVDIRNLMLPLEKWGKTDGLPDARKAYLENAEAVAKYGMIPKTHYFDSEDAGADIYPSIEGMTIGMIRKALDDMGQTEHYPSVGLYPEDSTRVDEVLDAENPVDDGVIYKNGKRFLDAYDHITLAQTLNTNEDILISQHSFRSEEELGMVEFSLESNVRGYIPNEGYSSVTATLTIESSPILSRMPLAQKTVDAVLRDGRWEFNLPDIKFESSALSFYVYLYVDCGKDTSFMLPGGVLSYGLTEIRDTEFTLTLKQIGFDISKAAEKGAGKRISFKTGACAGRDFVISRCVSTSVGWSLTLKRQVDETLGILFPNKDYQIEPGDRFVLLDIAMPELYIRVAQERLLEEGNKLLSKVSRVQGNYEPSVDAKMMIETGRTIREGMFMEITDEDVVDNTTDYILIDTLTIYEDESAIPTYKVTLRERRKVTYKGTPSATSSNETKPIESVAETSSASDSGHWKIDSEGNLTTSKNVVVKGDIASDEEGEGGSSIVGISAIMLNGTVYYDTDKDGIIDLGTIISGGGGLTSVSWADIKDRPTSLSQFANDTGYITSANLANYLPLSGGTITGGLDALTIKRSTTNGSPVIAFKNASKDIGIFGIKADTQEPFFYKTMDGTGTLYSILHSENIKSYNAGGIVTPHTNSTSIPDSVNALRYVSSIPTSFASWCTGYNNAVINIGRAGSSGYSTQLGFSGSGMYYRHQSAGTWTDWKTVAFTDSTVANATKLDGKSLLVGTWNGIPSISGGVMEIGRYIDFHHTADSGLDYTTRLTAPVVDTPYSVTLPSSAGTLALLTSTVSAAKKLVTSGGADAVYVDSSGRVGINTTSPLYRFDVNGDIGVNAIIFKNNSGGLYHKDGDANSQVLGYNMTNKLLSIGIGTSARGYETRVRGNIITLYYGTSGVKGFTMDENGNATFEKNVVVKGDIASA